MIDRRVALLTLLALPMGYFKALTAQGGWLTVDLAQWQGLRIRLGTEELVVKTEDIFKALREVS